ncbi:MAG TPA: hypothetical protein VGM83_09300 [Devosiaceae bacterium]|jgi:hypothetical protein
MMSARPAVQLDAVSRGTIGRFTLKLCLSLFIAFILKGDYFTAVAGWLAFYALFAVISACLFRQSLRQHSFNFWDEASWLLFVSLAFRILGGSLA